MQWLISDSLYLQRKNFIEFVFFIVYICQKTMILSRCYYLVSDTDTNRKPQKQIVIIHPTNPSSDTPMWYQ